MLKKGYLLKISSKDIQNLFGFSRQQLYYWRKEGIILPPSKTRGQRGHFRYTFHDLKTLKAIKVLQNHGISTFQIRKSFKKIREFFPDIERPFASKRVFVFDQEIIFIHNGKAYNAKSGQVYLLDFTRVEEWVGTVAKLVETGGEIADLKEYAYLYSYGD